MTASPAKSFRRRVLFVVLVSTLTALLIAAVTLIVYDSHNYRQTGVADLTTQAEILARSAGPALAFDDEEAAASDLAALRGKRNLKIAAIYDRTGTLFRGISEDRELNVPSTLPLRGGSRIAGNMLQVASPVMERGELLGTVYLESTLQLGTRLRDYALILALVMASSLLIALAFSAPLQESLTRPMQALTDAARNVVRTRDFSTRVEKQSADEIGVFVDAFNSMVEELGARAKALEAADRQKDEFLATLAHELRNPLSPMVNAVRILEKSGDQHMRLKALEMLTRQLTHMVRLVNDLLDVSRITTGKLSVEVRRLDLLKVLSSAIETSRSRLQQNGHELIFSPPPAPVWVRGDDTRLTQVFANLLDNSAKYTPAGGTITVAVEDRDTEVVVSITDTGVGIDADRLAKVFEMFTQLDNPLERVKSGLGVGLALARRLVELHGGTIDASSPGAGRGSTFFVTLPKLAAESAPPPEASVSPQQQGERRRILLVDDNVDYVQSLDFIFKAAGHDVRVAHDGFEALRVSTGWRPDLACLDIGMPGMDGYELARRLRRLPNFEHTTLVAVTGWGQAKDREQARDAGFHHHLVKPVPPEVIMTLLNVAMRVSEPAD